VKVEDESVFLHCREDGVVGLVRDDASVGVGREALGIGFDAVDDSCFCSFGDDGGGNGGRKIEGHEEGGCWGEGGEFLVVGESGGHRGDGG